MNANQRRKYVRKHRQWVKVLLVATAMHNPVYHKRVKNIMTQDCRNEYERTIYLIHQFNHSSSAKAALHR